MKTKILIYSLLISVLTIFVASCQKTDDDTQKPIVTNLEVGHNDTMHIGEGLHLEFEVSDNDLLNYYRVVLHRESEHKALTAAWEFDSTFTEINGLRNYVVHHHNILIPDTLSEAAYHFHLYVADMAGNTTLYETELWASAEADDHEE